MIDSILNSIKKPLGLAEDYDVFDEDVIMHINSVFSTLYSIGASPEKPIMIEDDTATWGSYFGQVEQAQMVKSYMYIKVRLLFDPPATSFTIDSMKRMADEWEWRLAQLEFVFNPLAQPIYGEQGRTQLRQLDTRLSSLEIQVDDLDDEIEEVPDLSTRFDQRKGNA